MIDILKNSSTTLSAELTSVSSRKEFQRFINSRLAALIPYSACTFFLTDDSGPYMENFFFDPKINLSAFPFNQSIPILRTPLDDDLDNQYFVYDQHSGIELGELFSGKDPKPYLNPESGLDGDSCVFLRIKLVNELLGYCLMLFPQTIMKEDYLEKLKSLLPHIGSTISRIKIIEGAEEIKHNFEILESINVELALNKNRNEVIRALRPYLESSFEFSHHFVFGINSDKQWLSLLLNDMDARALANMPYRNAVHSPFSMNESLVTKILFSNEPILFDLEFLASGNILPGFMGSHYKYGITKMAMVSLHISGERIGIWMICLSGKQKLDVKQLAFIKAVSRQISIAARDFQLAEVITERKSESDFLRQMSAQISMVGSRNDLKRFFDEQLRKKVSYEDVTLVAVNGTSYQLFLQTSRSAAWNDQDSSLSDQTSFFISDGLMAPLVRSRELYIFDVEQLLEMEGIPAFVNAEYHRGIRKKVGFLLKQRGMVSGALFFNLTNHIFSDKELELLITIALQISAAMSNVLANEDIEAREVERELLFSLSTQIASVRDKNQLYQVISSLLKPYFGFSHFAIAKIDAKKGSFEVFLLDPASKSKGHPEYASLQDDCFSLEDGFTNKIIAQTEPVFFNLNEISCPLPLPVKINKESGIGQVVGVKFSRDSSDLGFMLMFFEQPQLHLTHKAGLIKAIAYHISTAVFNIISNQEVDRLLNVRSQLLQFGMELRMTKDEKILSTVLADQLRVLFGAQNFLVTALSADAKSHRAIFFDPDSELASFPEIHALNSPCEDLGEEFFNTVFSAEPVVFNQSSLLAIKKLPRYLKALAVEGMNLVASLIKLADEPVGLIVFQYPHSSQLEPDSELFSSIRSQIAIVMDNLLSHQKNQLQLKEIEGYKAQLEEEKIYLTTELKTVSNYTEIVGQSSTLKDTFQLVSQVSASDSTVLILGETGTGKELVARAIHNNSPRKNKLLVKVNCAALPANLIESELFGHERGSFTGATERRVGKFELANGGTLFLDEVGEMPLDLQVKLLRALQEKEVERVGGRGTIKVDVRIIAATNRELVKEMEEGRFRSDLYYRLNIFPICLPPLRERKEDIELLVQHFIRHFSKKCGRAINSISSKALQDLQRYNWPGNVRELEHLIERSVLLASGNIIRQVLLPAAKDPHLSVPVKDHDILRTIDQNEREHIYSVLKYCGGRIAGKAGAAEILGVPPTTLNSKMKRLGIKRGHTM